MFNSVLISVSGMKHSFITMHHFLLHFQFYSAVSTFFASVYHSACFIRSVFTGTVYIFWFAQDCIGICRFLTLWMSVVLFVAVVPAGIVATKSAAER